MNMQTTYVLGGIVFLLISFGYLIVGKDSAASVGCLILSVLYFHWADEEKL